MVFTFQKIIICRDSEVEMRENEFYIKMSTGYMSGNWDKRNM